MGRDDRLNEYRRSAYRTPVDRTFFSDYRGKFLEHGVCPRTDERLVGILLTSGMSRSAILYGKMLFVTVMTTAIGAACLACALLLRPVFNGLGDVPRLHFEWSYCTLYLGATLLNAASSAYFSVWLPNPRLLHFINLFLLGFIMTGYVAVSFVHPFSIYFIAGLLALLSVLFTFLARREFESERIIKPVVL